MMMRIVCLLLMMGFLVGCKQSAEMAREKQQQILDSFKKVDSSLIRTSLSFQQDSITFQITELSVEIPQIKDSAIIAITNTCNQIESFIKIAKTYLSGKKEEDKILSNQYFINEKKGVVLFELLKTYKLQISKAALPQKVKIQADTILNDILGSFGSDIWVDTYFKDTPNLAAIMMLNKFNLDITRIILHVKSGK